MQKILPKAFSKLSITNDVLIYVAFALFFTLYLFISFHKVEIGNALLMASFYDMNSYLAIAKIDNPLELKLLLSKFPYHHLTRWAPNYLVGFFIKLSNASPFEVYRALLYLLLLFNIFLVYHIRIGIPNKICYLGFILLAPYTIILWLYAPAMLADALFYTAVIALAVGLVNGEIKYLYLAIFIGVFSRQTVALFIPIYLVYVFFQSKTGKYSSKFIIYTVLLLVFASLMNNYLLGEDKHNSNIKHLTGLYYWIQNPNFQNLEIFIKNTGAFLLSLVPLIILKGKIRWVFLALIYFFIVASQPIFAGPEMTGGNAARLMSLGIPLLGIHILYSIIKVKEVIFFIALLMLNCLHHNYSYLFAKMSKQDFLMILVSTTIASIVYIAYDKLYTNELT